MKYNIKSFGVLKTSLMATALYFVLSLVIVPFLIIAALASPNKSGFPFGMFFLIFLPFLYAALGFIFTAIACLVYNQVAKIVGGIEFTLEEKP